MKVRLRRCGGYVTCWGTSSAQSAAWQRVTNPALPWDWTDNREWNVRSSGREAQEFYVQVWICYLSWGCTWTKLPPCCSPGSVAWSLAQRLPVWGIAPDVVGLSPAPTHKFTSFLFLDILIFSLVDLLWWLDSAMMQVFISLWGWIPILILKLIFILSSLHNFRFSLSIVMKISDKKN